MLTRADVDTSRRTETSSGKMRLRPATPTATKTGSMTMHKPVDGGKTDRWGLIRELGPAESNSARKRQDG